VQNSGLAYAQCRRTHRAYGRMPYHKHSRLRHTGMAEPWRDRSEVSYLACILGL
jgi:hypothetical protein